LVGLANKNSIKCRFGDKGFSLLELVMVLLIISLAVGLSYPSLKRGTTAFHLRATGRDVLNRLRYAREKAITEQKEMTVTIDRNNQTVAMSDASGEDRKIMTLPEDVKVVEMRSVGQEITDGPLVTRFLPNGSAEDAEIVLKADNGGEIRVIVDPITGGSRIQLPQEKISP
jgi:prepilin-type N-terminal cleavage/methylation domain-containing protein